MAFPQHNPLKKKKRKKKHRGFQTIDTFISFIFVSSQIFAWIGNDFSLSNYQIAINQNVCHIAFNDAPCVSLSQFDRFSLPKGIKDVCHKLEEKFSTAKQQIEEISKKVPIGQYYR